jgi:MarR family transcriptional regulator, organic hydroperoxide resistance regulator
MPDFPYSPHESLGYLVHHAARAMSGRLNRNFAAAGYDVTAEQWKVLLRLWEHDGLTQNELCSRIAKNKASLTRLIDGLERRGLVNRTTGGRDRRSKRILLTPAGRVLRDPLTALALQTLAEAQAGLPESKLSVCREVLRTVFSNLSD